MPVCRESGVTDERKKSDRQPARFGEMAVRLGLVSQQQVDEGVVLQAKQRSGMEAAKGDGPPVQSDRVGEVLQRLGHIGTENIKRVLLAQEQERRTLELRSSELPEKRLFGDFELISKLGQGAMGAVYLARQSSLDRFVAMKILPLDMARDHEFLERFRREARAAARLNHPNIVTAYDVGVAGGYHYIAMEFIEGADLERQLKERSSGCLSTDELLMIAEQMAHALDCAFQAGIVHRDIKPANILQHNDGTYKLTDLGLAARNGKDKRLTSTGVAVGTPYYISPEQARGELLVDVRSDIYSLGASLYHLATGRLPFPGGNAIEVMSRHIAEQLVTPIEVNPDIPNPLSRLIEKMMAKRPEDRHQTPEELLEDIQRVRQGEIPVQKRALWRGHTRRPQPPSTQPTTVQEGRGRPVVDLTPCANRAVGGWRGWTGPFASVRMSPIARKALLGAVFLLTAILVAIVLHWALKR
jgi:serine/threonine-protein kinase